VVVKHIKELILALLYLLLLTPLIGRAQAEHDPFHGYVNVRYRYEFQHNFNFKHYGKNPLKGERSDGFLLQRVQAGGRWAFAPNIHVALGVQDARVFESNYDSDLFYSKRFDHKHNAYEDQFELYETYLEVSDETAELWTFKGGRQTILYGDCRIFGSGSWGNSGGYQWDAIKLSLKHRKHFIDFIWGGVVIHEPEQFSLRHRHKEYGAGFYSHLQVSEYVELEPFYLLKYDLHERYTAISGTAVDDLICHNAGFRAAGDFSPLFFDLNLVHQWGDYGRQRLDAWGAHLLLGTKFDHYRWNPILSIEYSFASGDSDPDDGRMETYQGVFGARDKMYRRMHFMDLSNLHDLQFNLELVPLKNVQIYFGAHRFWLDEKKDGWSKNFSTYRDLSGSSGRHLGDEVDFMLQWNLDAVVFDSKVRFVLMAGYCHFWPGEFLKNVADGSQADWVFTQIECKYVF